MVHGLLSRASQARPDGSQAPVAQGTEHPPSKRVAAGSNPAGGAASYDFDALGDLFELKLQRLGDVAGALRETFEAAVAGTVDASLGSEIDRCTARGRCPLCSERRKLEPVIETIERRRAQRDLPILRGVALETGFTVSELQSDDRTPALCKARFRAYWRLRKAGRSTTDVGLALNRDHTTVIYGLRKFEEMMAADPELAASEGYVPPAELEAAS